VKKYTFVRPLAGVVMGLLLLTACGGSDSDVATDEGADETTTTAITDEGGDQTTTVPGADEPQFDPGDKPDVGVPDSETPTELRVVDLEEGTGDEVTDGSAVEVHYVGVLHRDGSEFDSSWDRGQTFTFTVGQGNVISGWDTGLLGMKIGGRRQLDIPAALAYGNTGSGSIGPDEALTFVIDLVSITQVTITDTEVGQGPKAATGDILSTHFRGFTTEDGVEFANSYDQDQPIIFPLGAGRILPGWDQGLVGMQVGGKRELIIPGPLGFGPGGQPDAGIGPNAELRFEIELVEINPEPPVDEEPDTEEPDTEEPDDGEPEE